ncbi:MAG: HAD family hydrolase, partial [Candidatus Bipolaricaulis sp.]|nr:HAD family hydrolase [Candidatus Bipolaricaulis sp.]
MKKHKRGTTTDQLMRTCDATHIAFDLDFTLCTYPLTTAQVIAETFARCSVDADAIGPVEDLAAEYDALWQELDLTAGSARELRLAIWSRLLTLRRRDESLAATIATVYAEVRRETGVLLFEGVADTLQTLRDRGYGLGLLTNGIPELQWEKIQSLDLERRLDAIVVAGDVGWFKPDVRAFVALLDRLRAHPAKTLFVGDSYT